MSIAKNVKSAGGDVHAAPNTLSATNVTASLVDAETLEIAGSSLESPHACGAGAMLGAGDVAP